MPDSISMFVPPMVTLTPCYFFTRLRFWRESWEKDLASNEASLQLIKCLLDQRPEVEAWMEESALKQGRSRFSQEVINDDWPDLMDRFARDLKILHHPNKGQIECLLHMVLDQIALGKQVRVYFF